MIFIITWGVVFWGHHQHEIHLIERRTWVFLILSGAATGLSWLFYFKALQEGDVARVAPIDKLSVVITLLLAYIFLHEDITPKVLMGALLITVGSILMMLK